MDDILLNIVAAASVALIVGTGIYFCPDSLAKVLDKVFLILTAPIRWVFRPILRFVGITDRDW